MEKENLYAIVLAGGSGTRFWPLSRETWPKQMLKIAGEDTLLRQTIRRVSEIILPENIWIITTVDKSHDIRFHIESLGDLAKDIEIISEPIGRNTAPAIGFTAIFLKMISPDSIMIVMPSDHLIPDSDNFLSDLRVAVEGAKRDYLVAFGIRPNRPETGYGYIKVKDISDLKISGLLEVERFVEKPDLHTANRYISEGNYFWNSGIFVWKTTKILSEIEKYLPSIYQTLKDMESHIFGKEELEKKERLSIKDFEMESEMLSILYSGLESISIDYGVMEKSGDVIMVPATFKWSDLGSWNALDEVIEKDESGNIFRGDTIDIGSQNSIVLSGERLVATIGLKDMVVVDTPDATLVTPKERVQEVRRIVEALKKDGRDEYLFHRTVERPWGSYTVLEKGDGYKIKRILIKPKARLSLQLHRRRSEHWIVLSGIAKVTRGDETFLVHRNESTYIPINTAHRLENPENEPLQIIEVQNGDYLGEDDIERLEDDYGRI